MSSSKVVLEELVHRSLGESFFDTWRGAGGKMGALKGFSWLEVCFYIQNGLILRTFAYVYNSV